MTNPIRHSGITYPSQEAFAAAIGVHRTTVAKSLERGDIESCGLGRGRPIEYDGVVYKSIADAHRATGVHYSTLRRIQGLKKKDQPRAK